MTAATIDCQLLPQTMDAMQLGVVVLDKDGNIKLWNRWMAKHSGIPCKQALSQKIVSIFPELVGSRLDEAVAYACQKRLPSVLSPALHRPPLPLYLKKQDRHANRRMQQLIHIMPLVEKENNDSTLIQVIDMTATVNREKLLRQQADELRRTNYLDAVTGVANRRKFDEVLAEEFRRSQRTGAPIALAMLDIDHFKLYNDHYGHPQGDQCLARIAGAVKDCVKRATDLVARYGGEEFAIILPNLNEAKASSLIEDVRMRVATLGIQHKDSPVAPHVTISVGVAVMKPEIGADFNALVSAADVALYQAKHEGRDRSMLFSIADGSFRACG